MVHANAGGRVGALKDSAVSAVRRGEKWWRQFLPLGGKKGAEGRGKLEKIGKNELQVFVLKRLEKLWSWRA